MLRRGAVAGLLFVIGSGCSSSEPPSTSASDQACDLAALQANVLTPKCASAGCHDASATAAGDLDLASAGLAARTVGKPATGCGAQVLVKPGDPDGSYLLRKVVDTRPACGSAMPLGGPSLAASEIACLRSWIETLPPSDGGVDAGPDATVSCPTDRIACGDTCVDPQTDPKHCGTCSKACAAGQVCAAAACTCTTGLTACGAACVDTASDPKNCGACGTDCGAMVCASGKCTGTCPGTTTNCAGACVDTKTSAIHCGACGKACPAGTTCVGGACACPSGKTLCGDTCVDAQTDVANCGGCGKACGAGQSCTAGACGCGPSVSFAVDVQPIFTTSCTSGGCHGSGPKPAGDLSLVAGKSHAELVNVASGSCSGKVLVKPGAVDQSYLVNKLTGVGMCSGSRMPKADGALPVTQLDAIRAWICSGAKND